MMSSILKVISFLLLMTPAVAEAKDITYDKVIFVGTSSGTASGSWMQLQFRITDFRIDGVCYNNCKIGFTLDSDRRTGARADVGVRQNINANRMEVGIALSNFGYDKYGQVFVGTSKLSSDQLRKFNSAYDDEKLAIAWVIVNSEELIQYAVDHWDGSQYKDLWSKISAKFETSARYGAGAVASEIWSLRSPNASEQELRDVLQPALKELGFYDGEIDGKFGIRTKAAIEKLQKSSGKLETGVFDADTIKLIKAKINITPKVADDFKIVTVYPKSTQSGSNERKVEPVAKIEDDLKIVTVYPKGNQGSGEAPSTPVLSDSQNDESLLQKLQSANALIAEQALQISALKQDLNDASNKEAVPTEELKNVRRQLDAANQIIADNIDTIKGLKTELSASGLVENRAATVSSENETLSTQLSSANSVIADKAEQIAQLERSVSKLSSEKYRLTKEKEEVEAENSKVRRHLDAANQSVADLRESINSSEVVVETRKQLDAANSTIADLRKSINTEYVTKSDYEKLQRLLDAANSVVAELKDRIKTEYVSVNDYEEVKRQVDAINQTVADMREAISRDYILKTDHVAALKREKYDHAAAIQKANSDIREQQRQLQATSGTIADLQDKIKTDYVPKVKVEELNRQVSALNKTIVEVQDINSTLRSRMIESDRMFQNFRSDCAAVPACAKALQLE